jgi:hypothetical protein
MITDYWQAGERLSGDDTWQRGSHGRARRAGAGRVSLRNAGDQLVFHDA